MILATGSNFSGQLGIGSRIRANKYEPTPFAWSEESKLDADEVQDVQCGTHFTVVLLNDGKINMCGTLHGVVNPVLSPLEISLPLKCRQIACGRKHILALMERGYVMSWGVGYFGQLGHGDDNSWESPKLINALDPKRLGSRVDSIVCGGSHSGVLTESGRVFMWGLNRGGQCGVTAKTDAVMEPRPIDTTELGSVRISSLACGRNHSALITTSGRLFVWGEAGYSRLGLVNNVTSQPIPIENTALQAEPLLAIACGDFHMLALTRERALYSWGCGVDGQTGHSTVLNVRTPRKLDFFDGLEVTAIECGSHCSMAVTKEGHLFTWGYGDGGWLGVSPALVRKHVETDNIASMRSHQIISELNVSSFDSRHSVLRPQRVTWFSDHDCAVRNVRAGGGHMIAICVPATKTSGLGSDPRALSTLGSSSGSRSSDAKLSSAGVALKRKELETSDPDTKKLSHGNFGSSGKTFGMEVSSKLDAKVERSSQSSASTTTAVGVGKKTVLATESALLGETDVSTFMSFCRHKKIAQLQDWLDRQQIDIDVQDSVGNTALIVACQNGHLSVCQVLVQHRADLNLSNHKGNTALHYCFNYGYDDIGAFLIEAGADEYQTNKEGLTCYEGLTHSDLDHL